MLPKTPEPEPEVEAKPQEDKVWLWRLDWFLRLGFDGPEAEQLADSRADLHEAEWLVSTKDCPLPLAFRYLSD